MKNLIKLFKLILKSKRLRFQEICSKQGLLFHYALNEDAYNIFIEIFSKRNYSNFFPFYRDATIVDIGGHYGFFAVFASKNAGSKSKIYSFEPHPKNTEVFQKNLLSNPWAVNVSLIPKAVTSNNGTVTMTQKASYNHKVTEPKNQEDEIQVESITLDKWMIDEKINQIDFLKIDCEGSEYQILEELPADAFSKIHTISMEFHDYKHENKNGLDLVELLEKNKFIIKQFDYMESDAGTNYGKIVAINSNLSNFTKS